MATTPQPKLIQNIDSDTEGVTALMFKHEDEDEETGAPLGPVWATVKGKDGSVPVAEREDDEMRWTVWFPLAQARAMAKHYKLELEEV